MDIGGPWAEWGIKAFSRPPSYFSLGDLRNPRNKKIFKTTTRYSEPFFKLIN